jgi:calcineurin-like phosphoesterase family protein
MLYFTSDHHFWHTNIIKYCNRPFVSVEEMNEALIQNWNDLVLPEDEVYYLGDFSMAARPVEIYTSRLNGIKYLVPGNHDFCHSYNNKSRKLEHQLCCINKI